MQDPAGEVLLPGTAFVEMAVRAGDEAGCGHLAELTLEAPCELPAGGGVHFSAPFINRPVATFLLSIAIILAGALIGRLLLLGRRSVRRRPVWRTVIRRERDVARAPYPWRRQQVDFVGLEISVGRDVTVDLDGHSGLEGKAGRIDHRARPQLDVVDEAPVIAHLQRVGAVEGRYAAVDRLIGRTVARARV